VVALISDPQFSLSQEGFDFLAAEHAVMDLLFRASIFETSDHILPQIADNPGETDRSKLELKDGPALAKFLLTYSLRSGFSMNFEEAFQSNHSMIFALWVGMISPLLTVNKQAHERRETLLGLHKMFEDVSVPIAVLPSLSDAYMYCSYGQRRDKHEMKRTVHLLMERMLRAGGSPIQTDAEIAARRAAALNTIEHDPAWRPTMLVCIEWFTSLHAMYRCYAPIVRQLRKRFRLVAMCREEDIDDVGKREFDEWFPVDSNNLVLSQLIAKINEIAPDVVFHPSLGMALWWTALASVRLAPVQMVMLGHPASTRSPCMDYFLCEEGTVGDESLFSEKVEYYPAGSARFVMRSDAVFPAPKADVIGDNSTVKVAVPAMLCKLNAPFMAALQRIQQTSARPTEFHFFINMLGVNLYQSAAEIREWLPNSKIYERSSYPAYLEHLNECDLHCSTFPFGGTNSNIDSMVLGIPIVTLYGDEPHERYDGIMLRKAGMPESLITKTVDEYVAEAVRLINDDDERRRLSRKLRDTDIEGIFFGEPPEQHRDAIVDLVWRIFMSHKGKQ
jgi:hypothetical protein